MCLTRTVKILVRSIFSEYTLGKPQKKSYFFLMDSPLTPLAPPPSTYWPRERLKFAEEKNI